MLLFPNCHAECGYRLTLPPFQKTLFERPVRGYFAGEDCVEGPFPKIMCTRTSIVEVVVVLDLLALGSESEHERSSATDSDDTLGTTERPDVGHDCVTNDPRIAGKAVKFEGTFGLWDDDGDDQLRENEWREIVTSFLSGLDLAVPEGDHDDLLPDERGRDGTHTDAWRSLYDEFTFTYRQLGRSEAPSLMPDPDEADV